MGNNSVPKFIFRLSRFPVYRGSVLGRFYCTILREYMDSKCKGWTALNRPGKFVVTYAEKQFEPWAKILQLLTLNRIVCLNNIFIQKTSVRPKEINVI